MQTAVEGSRSRAGQMSALLGLVALVSAVTVASYLGWLGWDQHKYRVPGTNRIEGPYEPWQVVGLALTLAVLAAVMAWRRRSVLATLVITSALTLAWSVDAATERSQDANLWPVGAIFLTVGAFGGIATLCAVTEAVRNVMQGRTTASRSGRPS